MKPYLLINYKPDEYVVARTRINTRSQAKIREIVHMTQPVAPSPQPSPKRCLIDEDTNAIVIDRYNDFRVSFTDWYCILDLSKVDLRTVKLLHLENALGNFKV
ncbi:hypothetical protein E3N88_39783 [Mikania micrantha]|uniref:Uncharacterized protein n=1 Tax=Mikania micrantha TaxID=192012 RepID=A0A5N6LKV1_9ASTR|nr:hypothetical protein E3N88_39783 [Mikania micrantha]